VHKTGILLRTFIKLKTAYGHPTGKVKEHEQCTACCDCISVLFCVTLLSVIWSNLQTKFVSFVFTSQHVCVKCSHPAKHLTIQHAYRMTVTSKTSIKHRPPSTEGKVDITHNCRHHSKCLLYKNHCRTQTWFQQIETQYSHSLSVNSQARKIGEPLNMRRWSHYSWYGYSKKWLFIYQMCL
jgi:hypothetical protein